MGERDRPGRTSRRPADWLCCCGHVPKQRSISAAECFRRDAENCGRDACAPLLGRTYSFDDALAAVAFTAPICGKAKLNATFSPSVPR